MTFTIKLPPRTNNTDVVARLEKLLQEAKDGKIVAIAYVVVTDIPTQAPGTGYIYDHAEDWYKMLAGAAYLAHDLHHYARDEDE